MLFSHSKGNSKLKENLKSIKLMFKLEFYHSRRECLEKKITTAGMSQQVQIKQQFQHYKKEIWRRKKKKDNKTKLSEHISETYQKIL